MGEEINRSDGKLNGSIETTTAGSKRAAGNTSAAGTGTGTAAGTGTSAGPGTGKTKEEKRVPAIPSVEATENEAPAPAKPKKKATRKTTKKKKEPDVSYNASQLQALILSGSAILASRENMQMFALSSEEAQQLATPIANMIEKSEKLANMGEYADAIALATAAALIFIPRFILYADVKKQDKLRKNGGVKIVRTEGNKAAKINERDRRNAEQPAGDNKTDDKGIHELLSVTDGF